MKRVLVSIALLVVTLWFVGNVAAQSAASIQIVKPQDRRNVPDKNAQVTVQISGVLPNDGHYWELWVDEEPVVGVRNGEQSVAISFKPTGPHRLKAVLFDQQGNQLAVSNIVLVIAAPVDERKPQFNREMMAPFMAGFSVAMVLLIAVSVGLHRRYRTKRHVEAETIDH
ncbi:MAG: hypothetical protein IT331_24415 [Anaerolineae bacterium]|nr:hypothetical protein [Anaerolineae bacterium]